MTTKVADRSPASAAMVEDMAKGRALMGGTKAMRAAGKTYLPKFEAESEEAYKARLDSSWLFNGLRKTVRDMTGKVFDKPVELGEKAPQQIIDWSANIDMAGRDLSTFARDVFEDAMSGAGISYIMVDAPARSKSVTKAQAQSMNLRPYFVHLRVEDILGWKTDTIANVTQLTQLRIMETVTEPDPKDEFAEVETKQVRVLDVTESGVQTRLYRKADEKWAQIDKPTFSDLTEITVVPFYANRLGFFSGEPMLDDLADVNIAHWQSQSDQRNILHFARVPILFASGRESDEPLVVSAGMATTASDPQATMSWVEHTGKAIDAGRTDLKDLEFQMETFGLQLLVARGKQSATGEALDSAKETSTLSMTADQLQDTLEQAFKWMAEYGGLTDVEMQVAVNKEFGVSMMGAQEMTAMLAAVNTGNMSRETFLREMARRGMVAPDLDIEKEQERIDATAPSLTGEGMDLGT